ncbi:hypothetical protein TL16_g01330 [Triparma laevis f. inornata]|uniref:Uncharacterized protein n=1 Tax=Triparma laevis f. inornata TaxID=1714386 RepID=A0A9W6ZMD3_9STRA|nr:hypothetical protein TL16_g01330 [Triparma laevis f. inornata]
MEPNNAPTVTASTNTATEFASSLAFLSSLTGTPPPSTSPTLSSYTSYILETFTSLNALPSSPEIPSEIPTALQMLTPVERTMSLLDSKRSTYSRTYTSLKSLGYLSKFGSQKPSNSLPSTSLTSANVQNLSPSKNININDPYLALGIGESLDQAKVCVSRLQLVRSAPQLSRF